MGSVCGGHVHRRQGKPFGQRIAECSDSRENLIHDVDVPRAGCGPPTMLSEIERGRDLDEGVNDETLVNRLGTFDDPDLIADVLPAQREPPSKVAGTHLVNRSGGAVSSHWISKAGSVVRVE